jgi:hypothetical protein
MPVCVHLSPLDGDTDYRRVAGEQFFGQRSSSPLGLYGCAGVGW